KAKPFVANTEVSATRLASELVFLLFVFFIFLPFCTGELRKCDFILSCLRPPPHARAVSRLLFTKESSAKNDREVLLSRAGIKRRPLARAVGEKPRAGYEVCYWPGAGPLLSSASTRFHSAARSGELVAW